MAIWRHGRDGGFERASAPVNNDPSRWAILACPGPSLAEVDPLRLNGPNRTVFGINTAYPTMRPDIWIGMDAPDCFDPSLPAEPFPKFFSPAHKNDARIMHSYNALIPDVRPGTAFSFDAAAHDSVSLFFDKDTFRTALHLIILLGYRRIALLGCDMGHAKGHYCHDAKLSKNAAASNILLYSNQVKWMKWFHAEAVKRGIVLENCAKDSPLKEFMGWRHVDDFIDSIPRKRTISAFPHCREVEVQNNGKGAPLLIDGMLGLGDNIYQRPIVERLASGNQPVYLSTPWPQIYNGIDNVRFVAPANMSLRTQRRNINQSLDSYTLAPSGRWNKLAYTGFQPMGVPLYAGLSLSVKVPSSEYMLKWPGNEEGRARIAVIRPATIRKEWRAMSRNCKPEYIQHAVTRLKSLGYETWLLADIEPPHEVIDGDELSGIDVDLTRGQLSVVEIIDLIRHAAIVVAPVGFIVPMCMALSTPSVIIHGGAGGWNHPNIIDAPCDVPCRHVLPTNYCMCKSHDCPNCDKTIDIERIDQAIGSALQPG